MNKLLLAFGTAILIATITMASPTPSRAWGWEGGGGTWAPEIRVEPYPLTRCDWWWDFGVRSWCHYHVRYYEYRRHRHVLRVRG